MTPTTSAPDWRGKTGLRRVHLIGIGGMALSAIAAVLLERGTKVSGSDMEASPYTDRLAAAGARIHIGHDAGNITAADLVVFSAAVPADNPEIIHARELGIPLMRRAEFIGRLLDERLGIAIAGTHGKTTTTAMLAVILKAAGRNPGYLVGAAVPELDGNAAWGTGAEFVIEADEFDSAFLEYRPHVGVINHLEPDHLDYFGSFSRILDEFSQFAAAIDPDGLLLARAGLPAIDEAIASAACPVLRFGENGDWRISQFRGDGWGSSFKILDPQRTETEVHLALPGEHNALNALAAAAAAAAVGVVPSVSAEALSKFGGTERRFQLLAEARGIRIVSDYAHHPTEVRAALAAAKTVSPGRIWAVFQPHLRSRTRSLFTDFTSAFSDADRVTITEIFSPPGRETDDLSGNELAAAIESPGARFEATLEDCLTRITAEAREGDLILVMGAGDINRLGEWLAGWLQL